MRQGVLAARERKAACVAASADDELLTLQGGAVAEHHAVLVHKVGLTCVRKDCHTRLLQVTLQLLFLVDLLHDVLRPCQ